MYVQWPINTVVMLIDLFIISIIISIYFMICSHAINSRYLYS